MMTLPDMRAGKSPAYPDQAIYAEFAAQTFGLAYAALDGGSGLAFAIESDHRRVVFGGGRGSYFPQNNATAATLAADKYLSSIVLSEAGVPNLGGDYFFLNERHRAHRAAGHERNDAITHFHVLGGQAFVKPLTGSRGDFAQRVPNEDALHSYLDSVARHHDSIIMQPVFEGDEYRLLVLDNAVLYGARKQAPFVVGDGVSSLRELIDARESVLLTHGISSAGATGALDQVLAIGHRWSLSGRMNRSAGGTMHFATPPDGATAMAVNAVRALGLRAGGVDLFTGLDGDAGMRVVEINANPSIRFLEEAGRHDLILAVWQHTFRATGLLDE